MEADQYSIGSRGSRSSRSSTLKDLALDDLTLNDYIEADSTYGNDGSSNASLASSANHTILYHGRRFAASKAYWGPTDERALDTMAAIHMVMMILDSQQPNSFFRSPLPETAKNVLDIGTGEGNWAVDVAERYPSLTVRGVDISPPTAKWVPPNCILEVDDITKDWVWQERFDLVHIRQLYGALTPEETGVMYQRIYDNLVPGGWIEQVEFDPHVLSMDNRMPPDAKFASWGDMFIEVSRRANHPIDLVDTMRDDMADAGFTNFHEVNYKCPVGAWPKLQVYKDAGHWNMLASKEGIEGYCLFFLTQHGLPTPWEPEVVHRYVEEINKELEQPWNLYQHIKRVYAQKPY